MGSLFDGMMLVWHVKSTKGIKPEADRLVHVPCMQGAYVTENDYTQPL